VKDCCKETAHALAEYLRERSGQMGYTMAGHFRSAAVGIDPSYEDSAKAKNFWKDRK
jgi:hypothetical protein